jgi:CHAT domain-containing protein/tetratricopeptide (TPR) repeat protein
MIRRLPRRLVLCAMLAAAATAPATVLAQDNGSQMRQEYFIQQGADESLLIRINAFEAEFESKVSGPGGELLSLSGITGSRIAPVFQYINASKGPRQLDIEVSSNLNTRRSEFGLELTRLKVWDNRSGSLARAYLLLSFGMETGEEDTAADWTVKINSLVNAGNLFQQLGMQELRLWSNYLSAHLIHFHLHDHSIVFTITGEILAELKGARFQKIELAALQLQSAALIGLRASGKLPVSSSGPDQVQTALSRAASLAEAMGFRFEQASALNASAGDYAARSLYVQALEQFQLAVEIADSLGDGDLAKAIRESIVQIHALQGNAPASSEVLQEIENQLVEEGAGDELALNLLAQGRLLINSYRYGKAIDVLIQALAYENDSAIRRQLYFELAKATYETGRLDDSMEYLQAAHIHPDSSRQKRPNSVLDVGEGLRVMAGIQRSRGEFSKMRQARSAQGQFQPEQDRYLYEQALDELASQGGNHGRAQSLFRQSHKAASATGHRDLQHLSQLQVCALVGPGDALCTKARLKTAYDSLISAAVPRQAAEAMFLWAQLLVLNGRHSQAVEVMGRLADEIHFLRHSLPGVLGGWYQERHERLFEYYLELLTGASNQRGRADGSASLLALSKIRFIEKYSGPDPVASDDSGDTELLRVQLAQRASSSPGQVQSALNDKINRGLAKIRAPFNSKFEYLSKTGLQKYLRSLTNDELLLTYHISPTAALVWVGHKGKVQRRNIANPAYIYEALKDARHGLADIGAFAFDSKMDALGKRLVAPIADLLTETIYFIPAGPVLGFPLDALRVKGRYLVERHRVVNLVSFPANTNPGASLQAGLIKSVFLAGHPRDYSGAYATRLDTSAEIRAVADIFVGPGLRIVQGAALLPDEFQDERFRKASLVHLSMPGIIDLKYPEQSSLRLSGTENSPGRALFKPQDIRLQELDASLVFLSASRMNDAPHSGFISQPGLISDFVAAGARAVIASLWATDGEAAEAFITDFYHELGASGDIAASLRDAKRASLRDAKRTYLKNNRENGLYDWAGYQLFIE